MPYSPMLLCDFYKISHRVQYPVGTEYIYATWTPRSNKYHPSTDKVVFFGLQAFTKKYLIDYFNDNFFHRPIEYVLNDYKRVIKHALGVQDPNTQHIKDLHNLSYLPISIKAVPEGTLVPVRVPMMTVVNTDPRFFWLTNALETLISAELWLPCTSATIAHEYRKVLDDYAEKTGGDPGIVPFQGHDFSMRGMACLEASASSGAGHLLSFVGTDTIPAILFHERYYNANIEKELVGTSVNATEHSVMCAGGDHPSQESDTIERLMTEVHPTGILSIVSDTWDLWFCVKVLLKSLRDTIMARDGKIVVRPDSGDPVKILCGDPMSADAYASKGLIELLWDIFGGTVNEKGFKELDPHIGAIYGDSITLDRCERICQGLIDKGFASTNVVLGIGSYTYQYNTRDTFGFAMKTTLVQINGVEKMVFKDPATDDGTKKSAKGGVAVITDPDTGELKCIDQLGFDNEDYDDVLETVFEDSALIFEQSLAEIRDVLRVS